MAFPGDVNSLGSVSGSQTLAAAGHATRHNEVKTALEGIRDALGGTAVPSGTVQPILAAGSASAPSLSFTGDSNTGLWSPAADTVAFSTGGVERLRIDSSGQITTGLGSAAAPVLSFSGDTNTGVYSPAADNVSLSTGGTERLRVDSNGNTFGVAAQNLLYNGAMQVAQRGTSTASITTGGYYTADRWQVQPNSLGTWTQSVENDGPTGSGFRKSLKMLCTTADASPAAGDFLYFAQQLEGQDVQRIAKGTSSAQQLTLSFWVKSNATGTYVVEFYDNDNTRTVSASYSVSASATWERKTITFPADTTGAFDNDNAGSFTVIMWLAAGSTYTSGTLATTWGSPTNANRAAGQTNLAAATNNYWQVTGVQLEVGPIASPFQFKPYGQELRECQRYYYQHVSGSNDPIANGAVWTSAYIFYTIKLPVTMRANPNIRITSSAGYYTSFYNGTSRTTDTFGVDNVSPDAFEIVHDDATNPFTAAQAAFARSSNALSAIGFSAEL